MKEIKRISWVTDWRPPGTPTFPNYLYYEGYDIHVVRNSTQQVPTSTGSLVGELAVFIEDTANNTISLALLSDVIAGTVPGGTNYQANSIRCVPDLNGAATAFNNAPNTIWNKKDVKFNFRTGEISAAQLTTPGGDEIKNFNFLLSIQIKNTNGDTFETFTRVHIHDNITRAWLTPSALNIIKDEDNYRLSIHAEFSSGVVADISNHPGITWVSGTPGNVSIAGAGFLTGVVANASSIVTASISPALNNLNSNLQIASATVTVDPSWQTPPVTQYAELIKGPGNTIAGIKDFLVISEGYNAESGSISNGFRGGQKRYKAMTTAMVKDILKENSKEPYKSLLANNSLNIWRYYAPSDEKICTVLSEVVETQEWKLKRVQQPNTDGTKISDFNTYESTPDVAMSVKDYILDSDKSITSGFPWLPELLINSSVSSPNDPGHYKVYRKHSTAIGSIELTLSGLIRIVGLPTPADKNLTIAQLKAKWHDLYDPGLICYDDVANAEQSEGSVHVREITYNFWRLMADRRLLDERNTRFGISMGDKPKAYPLVATDNRDSYVVWRVKAGIPTEDMDSRAFDYNKKRSSRENINRLLLNLKNLADSGVQNPPSIGARWSYNGNMLGSDYNFVVFLCHAPRYGGDVQDNLLSNGIFCSLEEGFHVKYDIVPNNGKRRKIDESEYPQPVKPNANAKQCFVHEISHALGLGDEYGGNPNQWPLNAAAGIRNLQDETSLLTGGNLDGQKIKWRWLRIENAGVLTGAIPPAQNGQFTLTLRAGHSRNFEKDQVVYLRKRNLPDIDPNSQTPATDYIGPITIFNKVGDTLIVTGLVNPPPGMPADWVVVKLNELTFNGQGKVKVLLTAVTGSGTYFLTQLTSGSKINVNGQTGEVLVVIDDTSLILTAATSFIAQVDSFSNFTCNPPATEKFSELISGTVRKLITANNSTMTTYPCQTGGSPTDDQEPVVGQLAIGSTYYYHLDHGVAMRNEIVGLYANGAGYDCGVFHPTGTCLMRKTKDNINKYSLKPSSTHSFCPVCRYVLVDLIDPSVHKIMFDAYNLTYPKI